MDSGVKLMNVLCIGAHPDDIEIGCGGITAKLLQQESYYKVPIAKSKKRIQYSKKQKISSNVSWLIMTRGDYVKRMRQVRMHEQKSVKELLPNLKIEQGAMPDNYLHQELKVMVDIIEGWIREWNIDTVITHAKYDTHHDHRAIHQASYEASRKIPNLLSYEESITNNFNPNLFVDISEQLQIKRDMLDCHKSQEGRVSLNQSHVIGLALHRGAQYMQTKDRAYEAFEIIKIGTGFHAP